MIDLANVTVREYPRVSQDRSTAQMDLGMSALPWITWLTADLLDVTAKFDPMTHLLTC